MRYYSITVADVNLYPAKLFVIALFKGNKKSNWISTFDLLFLYLLLFLYVCVCVCIHKLSSSNVRFILIKK